MRSLKVKVCGMRRRANIQAVSTLCPDYMGFIFVPSSPRYMGDRPFSEVRDIPETTISVGVFQDASIDLILETVRCYQLRAVQLHGEVEAGSISALRKRAPQLSILRAVSVTNGESLRYVGEQEEGPDLYVFDGAHGGSGVPFEWDLLREYQGEVPFLLAGGIGPTNVDDVLRVRESQPRLVGIDINSKVEVAPGEKNPEMIQEIMERLSL